MVNQLVVLVGLEAEETEDQIPQPEHRLQLIQVVVAAAEVLLLVLALVAPVS